MIKHRPTSLVPPGDTCMGGIGHWPEERLSRQRCKLPSCKLKTYMACQKCNKHLCIAKTRNCFLAFHQF